MSPGSWDVAKIGPHVVGRTGFKTGRVVGMPFEETLFAVDLSGPTIEELAAMPPRLAMLLFGVAVLPSPIWRPAETPPPARRPARFRPRTGLGSGVVPLGRALSPSGGATEACGVLEHTRGATAPNARPAGGTTGARERERRGR